jgi:excisionase family DNA binding protein
MRHIDCLSWHRRAGLALATKTGESEKMDIETSKVLTVKELSIYLKVHPSTVYRQLRRGALPAFKVGSDWRFNLESIDRWRLGQDSMANG